MEEIEQVPKNQLAACETVAEVEAITWPEASK